MATASQHPSEASLRDFNAGVLAEAALTEVSLHLEECPACCQRLSELAALRAAPAWLRQLATQPAVGPADVTLAHVGPAKVDGDEDNAPSFLQSATRPGSLGRIGQYEVLQVLGKGGFGIVLRAFDDDLQRVVAIKVMAPQLAATSPARKRFLREARSSAAIRHENVVQVYDVVEQPLPYLVMEFIPGETLQQRLDRTGPLDVAEVLRLGRQIAEGLAAAHANDLIHRDIKPGNLLIEGGQRVKITDFGLARAVDDASMTQSGVIAGTPMYMAPEQALGHQLDQRADLFSLGSVLYQMVSGRPPFRAPSTVAVLKRVAEEAPRPIQEIIPEAPRWLSAIIAKLHAKNPADRYQTAREVADVLVDCAAQLKAHGRLKDCSRIPTGKPQLSGRWRWVAAAAALLLPVLALAVTELAGVTHLFREQQPTTEPASVAQPATPVPLARPEPLPRTFKNSIDMEFVLVPKGKSWLGGEYGQPGNKEVELPHDFYLGKYEVTQEEWAKVMGKNPSYFARTGSNNDQVTDIPDAELRRFPVDGVAWEDCVEFVTRLNELEIPKGWQYRLPTATEWEYTCRGGPAPNKLAHGFDYYFDQPTNSLAQSHANYQHEGSVKRPRQVGSYKPNSLGLYDMHGNVWEWCTADLKDAQWTILGGCWYCDPRQCRAAEREVPVPMFRGNGVGLRLVRAPVAKPAP